ncbi:MAG: electron transfer flavoprotein subunit beta/FixA family protein [Syntrophobacteraceae bacterium]|nr:electron transfer flavoprotein subunit beta/FixA family protein [Syntrophobacteraceae bacterium]
MHFVCCIKQVPDTAEVKIDPETNTLVRTGVESIANPYDVVALEEALRLREQYGGRVTAISMGPPQAESALREALAMGADEVVLLSDRAFAGSDTLATSYTLSRAVEKLSRENPVDVILCGKQAIDGDTAQTGPGIATRLGFTQFTAVIAVDWARKEERQIQVRRKVEGGIEVIRGPLPALLTVELELAVPRRASLPSVIHSLRAPIAAWDGKGIEASPSELGLKGSPTWVRSISSPPAKTGGPVFDAGEDLGEAVAKTLDTLFSDKSFASKLSSKWEA